SSAPSRPAQPSCPGRGEERSLSRVARTVVQAPGPGGFETLAELAPQPPAFACQSSLLNHRRSPARACSSTTGVPPPSACSPTTSAAGTSPPLAARSLGESTAHSSYARVRPIQCGTTQLTRTPWVSAKPETAVVKRIRPALAAAYSGEPYGALPRPALEETLT